MDALAIGTRSFPWTRHSRVYQHGRDEIVQVDADLVSVLRWHRHIQERVLSLLDKASVTALSRTTRKLLCLAHTSPLVHVLTRYAPVQSSLLAHLDVKDIIHLSKTTTKLTSLYNTIVRAQANINRSLGNYFNSPLAFRNLQARTDTLIAFDFAYDFFAHTHVVHDDRPLSLLVEDGKSATDLIKCVLNDGWSRETEPKDLFRDLGIYYVRLRHALYKPQGRKHVFTFVSGRSLASTSPRRAALAQLQMIPRIRNWSSTSSSALHARFWSQSPRSP